MTSANTDNVKARKTLKNKKNRTKLAFALIAALIIVGGIFYFATSSVRSAEDELDKNLSNELQSLSYSRASEINTWIKGIIEQSSRFTNSDSIKLFADLVDKSGNSFIVMSNSSDEDDPTRINVEIVNGILSDFIRYSGFMYGALADKHGDIYLSSDPSQKLLPESLKSLVQHCSDSGVPVVGPIMLSPTQGLYFNMFLPVSNFQTGNTPAHVVSVLYLTMSIGPKLSELLNLGPYSDKGFAVSLLQKSGSDIQNVQFNSGRIQVISSSNLFRNGQIPFGIRQSASGSNVQVYSAGSQVSDIDWWVVWEVNYEAARTAFIAKAKVIYLICSLGSLAILLFIGVIWWWMVGHERSKMLYKVQELNQLISNQKRLLDGINSSITDMISLTDIRGTYIYVNKSFAQAVGREVQDIPGLDPAAVFGFRTAEGLTKEDRLVLDRQVSLTIENSKIWLQDVLHYFQISKSPLIDGNGKVAGIISVFRDRTSMVLADEKNRRVMIETIYALVGAIEHTDPFLGGHSRIMTAVSKLLTDDLKHSEFMSSEQADTILTAAPLSQIGKMYVPREILTKPGMLTPEEKIIIEQHVEYTKNILKNVEFSLPVVETIYQMNERLDGKGYPLGLVSDQIGLPARVLAIANAFTAMARPRSYREAMDVHTVITILEQQKGSYDQQIVERLRACLSTNEGQVVVTMAAESQAV